MIAPGSSDVVERISSQPPIPCLAAVDADAVTAAAE
jgi:hypothetical protein